MYNKILNEKKNQLKYANYFFIHMLHKLIIYIIHILKTIIIDIIIPFFKLFNFVNYCCVK